MPLLGRCIAMCRKRPPASSCRTARTRAVSAAMRLVREGFGSVTLMGRPFAVRDMVRDVLKNEGGSPVPLAVADPASPGLLERNIWTPIRDCVDNFIVKLLQLKPRDKRNVPSGAALNPFRGRPAV